MWYNHPTALFNSSLLPSVRHPVINRTHTHTPKSWDGPIGNESARGI